MTTSENYKNALGISQSAIKDFEKMLPSEWKKIWIDGIKPQKDESTFLFGTVLDILLFSPESFDSKYYVTDLEMPSSAVSSIINAYFNRLIQLNDTITSINNEVPGEPELLNLTMYHHKLLLECAKNYTSVDKETGDIKFGWQNNWKDETIVNNLIKQGQPYFNLLVATNGREIIPSSLKYKAKELQNILETNPYTKNYFVKSENVDLIFQHEVYITIDEVNYKLSIDIKKIDHNNKTIQRIDFKTTQDVHFFKSTVKKYGYCKQLSFYDYFDSLEDLKNYPDYTTLLPINIAIDPKNKIPYIFEHSENDLLIEKIGSKEHRIIGWENTVQEIIWHIKNNLWEYSKEIYENGKIKLNLYE